MSGASVSLPPKARHRLICVLRLLGSEHQGERDAAALAADRLVRTHGLDWSALISCEPEPPPVERHQAPPSPTPDEVHADLDICRRYPGLLNTWERAFLSDLRNVTTFSPKQRAKLAKMAAKVRGG